MARVRENVLHGITEVGEEVSSVRVSWGATEQNGMTVQIDGEDVDVRSGQSQFLEDSFASARTIEVTFRLQYADLLNLKDALAIADEHLTGDLSLSQSEVLKLPENAIGAVEKTLYAVTPGPAGPRNWYFKRCKQRGGLTIEAASNGYVILECRFAVLRHPSGFPVEIEDEP